MIYVDPRAGQLGVAVAIIGTYGVVMTPVSEFTQRDEMQSNATGQMLPQPPQLWESAAVFWQLPSGHTVAPAGQAGVVSVTTGVSCGVGVIVPALPPPIQPAVRRKAITIPVTRRYVR